MICRISHRQFDGENDCGHLNGSTYPTGRSLTFAAGWLVSLSGTFACGPQWSAPTLLWKNEEKVEHEQEQRNYIHEVTGSKVGLVHDFFDAVESPAEKKTRRLFHPKPQLLGEGEGSSDRRRMDQWGCILYIYIFLNKHHIVVNISQQYEWYDIYYSYRYNMVHDISYVMT